MSDFREIFCEIMPVLEKAAPVISSLAGLPVAGTIIALLASLVDANPCAHEHVAQKLKDDPDLYAKLAKLESSHGDWLKQFSGI